MTGTEKKRAITTDMKDQNNYNLLYANSMKINLKIQRKLPKLIQEVN